MHFITTENGLISLAANEQLPKAKIYKLHGTAEPSIAQNPRR